MQVKSELFSPEIVSALENKKLLSHFRVYRKSATSAKTYGWIMTDGYTLVYAVFKNSLIALSIIVPE